jgi:hypothetical protein
MTGNPAELGPSQEWTRPRDAESGGAGGGRRVFLGNFTCELDWGGRFLEWQSLGGQSLKEQAAGGRAGGLLVSLTDRLRSLNAELAWSWLPLVRPGDLVLGVASSTQAISATSEMWFPCLPPDRLQGLDFHTQCPPELSGTLVPWGWTPAARDLAERLAKRWGHSLKIPPLMEVSQVNSRVQRWQWEQELGLALPGSRVIDSLSDFPSALRDLPDSAAGWILKANFGMSGREAIRGVGDKVTEPQRRFFEQRLAATGPLVLEPLLDAMAEAGVQWELSQNGTIALVGVAEQVAAGGSWQGSGWSSEPVPAAWREAVEATRLVAQKVSAAGYFGPLGIDVMRYRDAAGHERLRPLQDLNARFTMGRLALGWRDWLPAGWSGLWRVCPGTAVDLVRTFCEEVRRDGDQEVVAWLTTPVFPQAGPTSEEHRLSSSRPSGVSTQRAKGASTPSRPTAVPEFAAFKSLRSVRVLLAAADLPRRRQLEESLAARLAGIVRKP